MSFHGLEMARQALAMQQLGLYTTGHNISNINTEGYTRQRVNYETLSAYPQPSRNQATMPGQLGTGVQAGAIERIRDQFLDKQYRTQSSKSSYWETEADALYRMESIINEMDGTEGLGAVYDEFWKAMQDLAVNPDNEGARYVAAQKALALTDTFNHVGRSLEEIRDDLKFQLGEENKGTLGKANTLLRQIEELNEQISKVEPHGLLPNDLYDRRDAMIDELSELVNIRVEFEQMEGRGVNPISQGSAKIELVDSTGKSFENPVILLSKDQEAQEFSVKFDEDTGAIEKITYGEEDEDEVSGGLDLTQIGGSVQALVENFGYLDENEEVVGNYPHFMEQLNGFAKSLAEAFNEAHGKGHGADGEDGEEGEDIGDFFQFDGDISTITVNSEILKDPNKIAASSADKPQNGENAYALADVLREQKGTYDAIIAELAVKTQEANRQNEFAVIQQGQIQQSRDSVTAVSLDEEVTNLLKFQHAYNAAARSMTATDELLDKIINGMGIVGR